jgi:hypothetical protein
MKHCQSRGDQHPQPAPLPLRIIAVRVGDRSAGFIHVRHLFLADRHSGLLHQCRQAFAESATDGGDGSSAELNAKPLIQQTLHLPMAEVVNNAQKPHQGSELRTKTSVLHSRWQLGADCCVSEGAVQPVQLVLNHKRLNLGDLDHLMAMPFSILTAERLPATTPGAGEMGDDLRALLHGEEIPAGARMAVLAAALAATSLALLLG